jgi:FixJ family two-component response regulator
MPYVCPTIAILDDDCQVRIALARFFEAIDCEVSGYADAGEFLRTLSGDEPKCLIADLQMPAMTGLELLTHLKRIGRPIPTIIMTGFDEPKMRERCLVAGAAAYLLKPVRGNDLVTAVTKAIGIGFTPSGGTLA